MSCTIETVLKVRPLLPHEKDENLPLQWDIGRHTIKKSKQQNLKRKRKKEKNVFHFDSIFNEYHTNSDVFETNVKKIIDTALDGYNGTIIAYGESNSGKSYAMKGCSNDPGIIPLAIEYMFDSARNLENRKFTFKVSHYEIYNDKINDLLDVTNVNLKLSKSLNGTVQVLDCKEILVSNFESLLNILKESEVNRRTCENPINKFSDESHTILRLNIENQDLDNNYLEDYFSELKFVDLAGRRTFHKHQSNTDIHINTSLFKLNLMFQLNENADTHKNINYSDSKLTESLLSSFGGNTKTTFILTISPTCLEETQTTLWFGFRVRKVKNKPKLNKVSSYKFKLVKKLNELYEILKDKPAILKKKLFETEGCHFTLMVKIINDNREKFGLKSVVNIDDIVTTIKQFYADLRKQRSELQFLQDCINANQNIIYILRSIESDLNNIEPKFMVLKTYMNVLIENWERYIE